MKSIFRNIFVSFTVIVFIICIQSCSTSRSFDQTKLEGYWILKSLKGEATTEAFKGSVPSIEFDLDTNMISGSGGCNRYSGAYIIEGNTFKAPNIISSMRACAEANKENIFLQTLSTKEGLKISIENDILTFKENKNIVLEFNKASLEAINILGDAQAATLDDLVGNWRISKIYEKNTLDIFSKNVPTFTCRKDGSVNGYAGCNNYRSSITVENGTIAFGPMITTRMSCKDLEKEQSILNMFQAPIQAFISENKLLFSQNALLILELIRE